MPSILSVVRYFPEHSCHTNLEQLKNVVSHIIIHKFGIQTPEICVVDVFKYQRWRFALIISHNIQEGNDVWSTREVLKNFDFTLYLLFFHWLEDLDDAFLIVNDIYTFENLRVFPSSCGQEVSKWDLNLRLGSRICYLSF